MRPCLERSGFFHSRYDEAGVFDDILIFVCSTPSRDLLWLYHRVIIMVGRWLSEFFATILMKFNCCVVIFFLVLGISNNFLLTDSFLMLCSFASGILMPSMRWILLCIKTSSFL